MAEIDFEKENSSEELNLSHGDLSRELSLNYEDEDIDCVEEEPIESHGGRHEPTVSHVDVDMAIVSQGGEDNSIVSQDDEDKSRVSQGDEDKSTKSQEDKSLVSLGEGEVETSPRMKEGYIMSLGEKEELIRHTDVEKSIVSHSDGQVKILPRKIEQKEAVVLNVVESENELTLDRIDSLQPDIEDSVTFDDDDGIGKGEKMKPEADNSAKVAIKDTKLSDKLEKSESVTSTIKDVEEASQDAVEEGEQLNIDIPKAAAVVLDRSDSDLPSSEPLLSEGEVVDSSVSYTHLTLPTNREV